MSESKHVKGRARRCETRRAAALGEHFAGRLTAEMLRDVFARAAGQIREIDERK